MHANVWPAARLKIHLDVLWWWPARCSISVNVWVKENGVFPFGRDAPPPKRTEQPQGGQVSHAAGKSACWASCRDQPQKATHALDPLSRPQCPHLTVYSQLPPLLPHPHPHPDPLASGLPLWLPPCRHTWPLPYPTPPTLPTRSHWSSWPLPYPLPAPTWPEEASVTVKVRLSSDTSPL